MTSISDLVIAKTKAVLYSSWLALATGLGVPVTSWEVGDPTDSLAQWVTEEIAALEVTFVDFCKSAFLDYAAADSTLYEWLCIVAEQNFGYIPRVATYATCTYRLSNTTGAIYSFDIGDLTVKNMTTGATYHNTEAGTLLGGSPSVATILDLAIEADLPGAGGTSAIGEIDELVTTFGTVSGTNLTAAVGQDAEPATSIVAGCRAKLARMTNGGPKDAYVSVALDSALTGTTEATKARSTSDSVTGQVSIYVASPSGTVTAPSIALIQATVDEWAVPLCITPTVYSATAMSFNIQYSVVAYKSWGLTSVEAVAAIDAAITAWFADRPIGGDIVPPATIGILKQNMIEAAIRSASDKIFSITLIYPDDLPYAPLATDIYEIAAITGAVVWANDP